MNYPVSEAQCENTLKPMPLSHRLKSEKERLERRLSEVNDAIDALQANPAIADAIEKLSKLGHF